MSSGAGADLYSIHHLMIKLLGCLFAAGLKNKPFCAKISSSIHIAVCCIWTALGS